jgi:UDP-N-acetylmuramate--alanine ligase
MTYNTPHFVHGIGANGIGVSAILRYMARHGARVSGSDKELPPEGTLPKGTYYEGHDASHISNDVDLVVYSPAVPEHNSERVRARELGITEMSYPEALRAVTMGTSTIGVSGTHGKSTTTAIMGKLFEAGGFDPSVIVGAGVPGWDHNYRMGVGSTFIVEACEYRRHMLLLSPHTIVLTNLELDHPDYYRDLADIKDAFRSYVSKLEGDDVLVYNADDVNVRDVTRGYDAVMVRYGIGEGADLYAKNVVENATGQKFELVWKGTSIGLVSTPLPGLYNVYNILAATATYLAHGGDASQIAPVLSVFHGVGRRFEELGAMPEGPLVVSDYAHHPTALEAVLQAASSRYAQMRVLAVFRPHHRERTIKLFDAFVEVLRQSPVDMMLVEIYDVAGREEETLVSSQDLIARIPSSPHLLGYTHDTITAVRDVRAMSANYDVILVIGAGDADQLARALITRSS